MQFWFMLMKAILHLLLPGRLTEAWKPPSSFQCKKSFLEMKMRCVNSAGFLLNGCTWLVCIFSVRSARNLPLFFNYTITQAGLWRCTEYCRARLLQTASQGDVPLVISSHSKDSWGTRQDDINMTQTHLSRQSHTSCCMSMWLSSKVMHNIPDVMNSLLCCSSISSFPHINNLHIKQLNTC